MRADPAQLLFIPVCVLSVVVHECAHGWVARWRGDPTARDQGRLTLNPFPHLSLVGSILVPSLFLVFHAPIAFAWARPIPLDRARLRRPRNDSVAVALAGPAANFLLALGFALLVRLAPATGFWSPLRDFGYAGVLWNCALGILHLVPIPPLDGAWVLMRFLRLRHIVALHHFRRLGLALVALLLVSPVTSLLIRAPLRLAIHACLDLVGAPRAGSAL